MLDPHRHIRVGDSTMHVAAPNRCKKPESANIKLSCPLLPSYGKLDFQSCHWELQLPGISKRVPTLLWP